jgi:uncharacterized protein YdeI (YjbR/CyaY-like superfamily)
MNGRSKTFRATLERLRGKGTSWVIARLPFSVQKAWKTRGHLKVVVQVNAFEFRTALLPTRIGQHFLIVNKKTQRAAGITEGSTANFTVTPDSAPQQLKVPPELEDALSEDRSLKKFFESFSPWVRRWLADNVTEAKSSEVRKRRSMQIAERLLQTMDAEEDLPPMLRRTLRRHGAEEAWQNLTGNQRRRYLLGIFQSRTPESQNRRLEKVVEIILGTSER